VNRIKRQPDPRFARYACGFHSADVASNHGPCRKVIPLACFERLKRPHAELFIAFEILGIQILLEADQEPRPRHDGVRLDRQAVPLPIDGMWFVDLVCCFSSHFRSGVRSGFLCA
jgi:hypothetical protein